MELFREFGHVDENGDLKIYNRDQFLERVKVFAGQNVELVLLKRTGTVSHQQIKYYFAVIVPEVQKCFHWLGDRLGIGKDRSTVDHWLRVNFLYLEEYHPETDSWSSRYRRLNAVETDVSIREFAQFIDDVVIWFARELKWSLPYPNELFNENDMTLAQRDYHLENPFD